MTDMRYRLFGRSGLRVSELCLGTVTFGDDWGWGADCAESRAIFDVFAERGGNFIDTAHVYTEGSSERLVGEFVASDRDHFVIATKYTPSTGQDILNAGNSRKTMMRQVDESLERLKTDHIDLYYIHFWDGTAPIEEVMRGLDDLVRQGKVLYVAASDLPAWQVSRANMLADLRGWSAFIGLQVEYSLAERTPERELLPMADELGLGVLAWSPLAGGALTGKYKSGASGSTRKRAEDIRPRTRAIADAVVSVAREAGVSPSQVALAAIRQQRRFGPIIPILGARNRAQLEDNLGCLDVSLDPEQLQALDQASAIELGFPHDLLASTQVRNWAFGGRPEVIDLERTGGRSHA